MLVHNEQWTRFERPSGLHQMSRPFLTLLLHLLGPSSFDRPQDQDYTNGRQPMGTLSANIRNISVLA